MLFASTYGQPLNGVVDDIQTLIDRGPALVNQAVRLVQKVGPYMNTIEVVLDDPALPQVVQRVQTIRSLEVKSAGGNAAAVKGIGLKRAIPILDAYIWYRKNPWVPWAAGAVAGLLVLSVLKKR